MGMSNSGGDRPAQPGEFDRPFHDLGRSEFGEKGEFDGHNAHRGRTSIPRFLEDPDCDPPFNNREQSGQERSGSNGERNGGISGFQTLRSHCAASLFSW
jgi:hypothetical protein